MFLRGRILGSYQAFFSFVFPACCVVLICFLAEKENRELKVLYFLE